ncbi:hypothetical protein M406DRAFT_247936 [Cryphonectria parasitica EP155]|uniref:Uncharacterized protein n=1 Tax=Cryphonectria parasitica (strain ATCC 38755 / EP155) TaxID=660469 RepID=A0A9P5CSR9_CRYP1|nr:uncharacterized protein M406DRAFT_247936 [Cryphonectria parasitica EP155]KAF3769879.1 hypothetical protein M406DRAFT_247936 [Cryphonectria parasitica EP155]
MAPAVPGTIALSSSTILLVLQIILALPRAGHIAATEAVAVISAILELAVLILLSWILFTSMRGGGESSARKVSPLLFGSGIGLCVLVAVLTVGCLISLSINRNLGGATSGFLAGTAIMLLISFITQLLFLVTRHLAGRSQDHGRSSTPGMQEIGWQPSWQPARRVKAVPYESTLPPTEPSSRAVSMESKSPRPSTGGFSATDTISTITSTLAHAVRPITSRNRLISGSGRSQRSVRRAASIESMDNRARSIATIDSFDSWDTSGVDAQCRQTVLESGSSPLAGTRFLETIPASPTTSRCPSPGTPLDLDSDLEAPWRVARRSRSFSPAGSARSELPAPPPKRGLTQHTSASESHIHPLFRSDSPTPAPLASPGTIVIAAPQAGWVISDRQSIRSLRRMRSGSLPAVSSPLTLSGSSDSFNMASSKTLSAASDESSLEPAEEEEEDDDDEKRQEADVPEREITPPIPDFILNAGSRTSLVGYQVRKTESREGPSGPGLEALPPTDGW